VDTVVFDKTGTLTTGSPTVVDTVINPGRSGYDQAFVLSIAAALEADSSHPVARAFSHVQVSRDTAHDVKNFENGVRGRVADITYRLGNAAFSEVSDAEINSGLGRIWLSDEQGWIAYFDLDDGLREAAADTIRALRDRGLELIILSGDHPSAVESVARRTGIGAWHAEQNPKRKMEFLENLQEEGKTVLMVGDGINDAPVLAVANASMTVSGASELANSAADFILTDNSMIYVDNVFTSGFRTRHIIRQNLLWALVYNLSAVPFAAAGFIVPWMAALGMSLRSLLVVLNSGRLAKRKPVRVNLGLGEVAAT